LSVHAPEAFRGPSAEPEIMTQSRKYLSRATVCVLIVALALGLAVLLRTQDPAPVAALRNATFDSFQRIAPRPFGDFPVRVVDVDERSLAELGQWPWPRDRLALLMERLTELGAAAVALDMIFAEPDRTSPRQLVEWLAAVDPDRRQQATDLLGALPDHDVVFAEAIAKAPVVAGFATLQEPNSKRPAAKGGYAFAGSSPAEVLRPFPGAVVNLPVIEDAARGVGSLSLGEQVASGVVRRLPLLFYDGKSTHSGLVLEALRVAQAAASTVVRATGASGEDHGGRAALVDLKVGDLRVPLTAGGELVLFYDRDRPERYLSARDILDPSKSEAVRPRIEGQIVFVGTSAAGLLDQRMTALGELVPGVSIHAQAAEQILSQEFLHRPDWADGLETILTVVLCLVVAVLLLKLGARYAAVY
jgi:adenylate cyclase